MLKLFARGNHSLMAGATGKLDTRTPGGMFSLDFGGSQGAHPGHSGILLGDPAKLDAGRFSAADFERLKGHAENGLLTTDAVGAFIADNIARDPDSKRLSAGSVALAFAGAGGEVLDSVFAWLGRRRTERDAVELAEKLAGLAREDNLLGSAGEFGLMFALLANRPGAEGDAVRLADVEEMMVHHLLPPGWESWAKKATDWLHATAKIAFAAIRADD